MSDEPKPRGYKTLAEAMAAIRDHENAKRREASEASGPHLSLNSGRRDEDHPLRHTE